MSNRLRTIRQAQGRRLKEVATEAGMEPSQLSRLERGLSGVSVEQLVRLYRVLGLSRNAAAIEGPLMPV